MAPSPSTPLRRGRSRRGKAITTAPPASISEGQKRRSKKSTLYVSVEVGSRVSEARTSTKSRLEVNGRGEAGDEARNHDTTEDQRDEAAAGGDGDEEEEGGMVNDIPWVAPTKSEWNDPELYRRFRRCQYQDAVFEVNHYVWIKGDTSSYRGKPAGSSSGMKRDDGQWIGKIVRIRASGADNVCIQVAWVYTSLEMIRDSGCRNPPTELQDDEVVMSNINDIVSISSINDFAEVHEFDESSFLQDVIPDGSLYYRSKLLLPGLNEYGESSAGPSTAAPDERKTRKRKRAAVFAPRKSKSAKSELISPVIEPVGHPTCVCGESYEPYPMDAHPMVFCPESDCQKWYHTACLSSVSHPVPLEMEQLRASGLGMMEDLPWRDLEPDPVPAGRGGGGGVGAGAGAGVGVLGDVNTPSTDDVDAEGIHDRSKGLIKAVNGVLGSGSGSGVGKLAVAVAVDAAGENEAELTLARIRAQVAQSAEESIVRGTAEAGIVGSAKRVLSARELLSLRSTGAVGDKVWRQMAEVWAAWCNVEEESSVDRHHGGATGAVGKGDRAGHGGGKKGTGNSSKKGRQDLVAAGVAGAGMEPTQSHAYWRCPTCQNVI